ncbi:ABC transporter ATP-binding protein [Amaricoccus solimangrovi]|uniref:ABC transporter ATP-binding protein n=1 Tax=Amaricoccus solimangrovi TaxID=2589815 RepID=A0A501WLZ8_9RHOB|nr:ABC transporter ATP-binding protein [Amaricoccus solimangrovi]TPE48041.1 ABC transporter ATP-binding protein [Amaricoccus solimangrovi]
MTKRAHSDAAPLLEVSSLGKAFGGVQAVGGVDLRLERGEVVTIIGPNGSGKSTFFNLLTGIYAPDSGAIRLEGVDLTGLPGHRIAQAGIARTFQNIRLFNNLTVIENVMIGMHTSVRAGLLETVIGRKGLRRREEAAREAALAHLSLFRHRLFPRLDHPVFTLSYANRRRVEIARALAVNPKLLLLDEPTAGMNPYETAELVENIQEIRASGLTMAIIEHKLDVVNRVSDFVVVLDQGKKIAEGDAETVRNDTHVIEAYLGHPATAA